MFFISDADVSPRENSARNLDKNAGLRRALLVSTILGAGALLALPDTAWAQTSTYSGPAATGSPETSQILAVTTGTDQIVITTTPGGTITTDPDAAIDASSVDGDINLTLGAAVAATNARGVNAVATGAGNITVKTATGVTVTGLQTAIRAVSNGATVDIGGTTGLGGALSASDPADGAAVIFASGMAVNIKTASGGSITGGNGISSFAVTGPTTIDIGADITATKAGLTTTSPAGPVTSAAGISATSVFGSITISGTGDITAAAGSAIGARIVDASATGDITITASGRIQATGGVALYGLSLGSGKISISGLGQVTSTTDSAIVGISQGGGDIDIGGTTGLSSAVTGGTGTALTIAGIVATTNGAGKISIKTTAGGIVSAGGVGAYTEAVNGATTISVGDTISGSIGIVAFSSGTGEITISTTSAATITGTSQALQIVAKDGDVTVNNAGKVKGTINATLTPGGAATANFNNTGTFELAAGQSSVGFTVNNLSGGVLTGTGSFGAVNAAAGSIIRAGDRALATVGGVPAMGTLNASSLTLATGAIVEVRADFTGVNDKVAVSGAAALNGATLRVLATPRTDSLWTGVTKTFTVLTAGSLTGAFAATETDYAFLKVTTAISGNNVLATLERNWVSFGIYSTTPNQKSVSDAFDRFQTLSSNALIAKVTTLTIAQAPVAMAQLSGTGLAVVRTQSFATSAQFNGAVDSEMGKFTGSPGGGAVLSYADDKKVKTTAFDRLAPKPAGPILDGRVWAQVLGGFGAMRADATNPSERSTNFGFAAGADTAINPHLRAGFALSGGQSTSRVASLATSADATWGQAALYGVATDGDRYAKAALVYGYLSTETQRTVTAFSAPETAKGKFGANLFSTRLEVGQKFVTGGPDMTPFFAFEPSLLVQNAYSETGAATIGLGYGKTTIHALPATLGMKFGSDLALDGMRVAPSATLGWVHNFAETASLSPFFTALPGSTFTVAGAKGDRDLARTELNLEATPDGSTAILYANARADLGARTSVVRGTAGAMMRF